MLKRLPGHRRRPRAIHPHRAVQEPGVRRDADLETTRVGHDLAAFAEHGRIRDLLAVGHRWRLTGIHVLQPRLGARIQGKVTDRYRAVEKLFAVIAQPAAAVASVLRGRAANLAIPVPDE